MKKNKSALLFCYIILVVLILSIVAEIITFQALFSENETSVTMLKHFKLLTMTGMLLCCAIIFVIRDYLKDITTNAYKDVTGIHNKKSLEKKIQQLQERSDTLNIGIMMFDLNNLKHVNDSLGHEKGDELIQSFASCLTRILTSDSFLARFGGDEFVIIQENTTLHQLAQMDTRLQTLINEYNNCTDCPISYAIGYDVSYKNHYYLISDLMNEVDKRMYQDKTFKKKLYEIEKSYKNSGSSATTSAISSDVLAAKIHSVLYANDEDRHFAIILSDIDNFHYINDSYGYPTGNHILNIMLEEFSAFSSSIHTFRFHSDIFISIVDVTNETAKSYTEKLIERNLSITRSVTRIYPVSYFKINTGVYFIKEKNQIPEDIISYANVARRLSKKNPSHICIYSDEIDKLEKRNATILHSFQDALSNGDFEIYFQPKLSCENLQISSAEVLVRWIKYGKMMWSPEVFIPILEQTGYVIPLDFYVYEKAFQWISLQKQNSSKIVTLSLNVSPVHFNQPELFIDKVLSLINHYNIDTRYIIFEITESAYIENTDIVNHIIQIFHKHNIRISMDDFGSGYSSLNTLKNILFDEIKLDKQFLSDELTSNGKIVLQELFHMLKRMNKSIVCEGVETQDASDFLISEHCDELQGFLYYKPMCKNDFTELLAISYAQSNSNIVYLS